MRALLAGILILLGSLWVVLSVANIFMGGTLLGSALLLNVVKDVLLGLVGAAIGLLIAESAK